MPHPFADFYRGKRVLVSGHTLFPGGWLTTWLKLMGAQVCGFGPPPSTRPNFFDATLLDRGMTSIFGDLRNREALADVFADFQPEIVIHYPVQVSAARVKADPVQVFDSHVMGALHILEETRQIESVRAVVIATAVPDENTFIGTTAACAGLAVSAYANEFFRTGSAAIASARSGGVIGGGNWPDVEVSRDLAHERIHVFDLAHAHLLLAHDLFVHGQEFSGAWIFASGEGDARARDSAELGWKRALSVEDAIAWIGEWHQAFDRDPASAWRTSEDQIRRYMQLQFRG